jgi:RNA polymerase sigma-70 factor, ECF subfamily
VVPRPPWRPMNACYDESSDECLVQSTLTGNDEAFAALVRRHKSRVFGIASRFAQNDHELDDVCQEIFIKAYRNLAKFRGDAPFVHWLSRIAVRACYDLLRRTRHERGHIPLEGIDLRAADDCDAKQARELLAWALERLSAEDRLVITLLELEERSVREIAVLTGWSESKVKVRAHRARQALKKILEADHER